MLPCMNWKGWRNYSRELLAARNTTAVSKAPYNDLARLSLLDLREVPHDLRATSATEGGSAMTNVYPDRIEELHQWLELRYGHKDRQATEVLLAALLPTTLTARPRPWIVIETDWPSRVFADAWFSFGDLAIVRSLAMPRALRTRDREPIFMAWLNARAKGGTGLLVECDWTKLPRNGGGGVRQLLDGGGGYRTLLAGCVRLRVQAPKGPHGLGSEEQRHADRVELARLASRVVDSTLRSALTPRTFVVSQSDFLKYWCELVQMVAPLQTDWDALIGSVAAIAHGIGVLRNDGAPDWPAAERVLRDCIPWYTEKILAAAFKHQLQGRQSKPLALKAGLQLDLTSRKEIKRLAACGVIRAVATGQNDWAMLLGRDRRLFV